MYNRISIVGGSGSGKRHIILEYLKDIPKEKVLIFKKQKDLNIWLKHFTHNEDILKNI